MLKMCEKVTKIFRNRSTATVRTDFVTFSRRFSVLAIRSRFQSPFLGLYKRLYIHRPLHTASASITPRNDWPFLVNEYSTRGGTSA